MSETDVKDASQDVLKDLKRFQSEKEDDLKRYMVESSDLAPCCLSANYAIKIAYAKCHIDWAKKNAETWKEAKEEVAKIDVR